MKYVIFRAHPQQLLTSVSFLFLFLLVYIKKTILFHIDTSH